MPFFLRRYAFVVDWGLPPHPYTVSTQQEKQPVAPKETVSGGVVNSDSLSPPDTADTADAPVEEAAAEPAAQESPPRRKKKGRKVVKKKAAKVVAEERHDDPVLE